MSGASGVVGGERRFDGVVDQVIGGDFFATRAAGFRPQRQVLMRNAERDFPAAEDVQQFLYGFGKARFGPVVADAVGQAVCNLTDRKSVV